MIVLRSASVVHRLALVVLTMALPRLETRPVVLAPWSTRLGVTLAVVVGVMAVVISVIETEIHETGTVILETPATAHRFAGIWIVTGVAVTVTLTPETIALALAEDAPGPRRATFVISETPQGATLI